MKTFVTLLVTGTPGTGKTWLAKKLSLLLDYAYFNVGLFVKKAHLYSSYDRKRHTYVVDEAKLARRLIRVREALKSASRAPKTAKKGIIFDSHMSHYLPSKCSDLCIVTSCSLKTLQQRLRRKGYGQAKVRENLDAEIFDTCLAEAQENGHKILKFDTTAAKNSDVKAFAGRIRELVRT
ncbi:adenylate kinase family protein [Candidatus Woesearchaeota archaeon]|nr:adenylate kinase family protein [Candidatus Woesearchaeota archaeon]